MKTFTRMFCLFSIAWIANPVVAAPQCPTGTVGYWPMEVDGTEVVNNIAGSLVGGVSFSAGQAGQAAYIDGDIGSYIDAGMSALLTGFGNNSMSLSAWVYRETDGTAGDSDGTIITARSSCNTGNWQFYSSLGSSFYYSKWDGFGQEDQTFSSNAIPLQVWTHVAVTYASNEVRFYINGNLDNTVSPLLFGGNINPVVQDVQIGWDSCGSYFNGGLDEVAIFDVTLTQAEVSNLYLKGFNGQSFCSSDADDDGVDDELDICPLTTGTALLDGCDCSQILDFKPGSGGRCNRGTLSVFANRIGWASDVPVPPDP